MSVLVLGPPSSACSQATLLVAIFPAPGSVLDRDVRLCRASGSFVAVVVPPRVACLALADPGRAR